jgi:hypothetical protein
LTFRFSFCSSRRTRRVPILVSSFCHLHRPKMLARLAGRHWKMK